MKRGLLSAVLFIAALGMGFAQDVRKVDTLTANDEKYQGKTPIRWYTVALKAGNRLAMRAASVEFTPVIVVNTGYGPDRTIPGRGGSASASYSSDSDASVKIGVTSGSPTVPTGTFMIRIVQVPSQTAIKVGDRISAELAYDDETIEDSRNIKWYTLPVKKGQRLSVAAWSTEFTPSIVGSLPGDVSFSSEEYTYGSAAARLAIPADGEARIGVSTESSEEIGAFTLQVVLSKEAKAVTAGQTVSGSLKDGDDMLAGKPMDAYRLHGKANTRVIVQLSSSQLDTVLYVDDGKGRVESSDDAYDTNSDSQLSYTFTQEGDIELRVYAVDESERGDYKLTVREVPPPPGLKDGDSIDGTLSQQDEEREGKLCDRYMYTGAEGQSIRVDLASEDFDAYLFIIGVSGEMLESDDASDDTTDSQLVYSFPKDGTIQILVTTLDEGESGDYTLNLGTPKKR